MKELTLRQKHNKLLQISQSKKLFMGVSSWIRYVRKALGMTPRQLAERMAIATSTLHQLERQEAGDKVSLGSLKKAAEALNCDLVYGFAPRHPLTELIEEQAYKKAKKILNSSSLHMEYEDQAVKDRTEQVAQLTELIEQLKQSKLLWE